MERAFYEAIVRDTVDALPEKFRNALQKVAIVIEEQAPPQRQGDTTRAV